MWFEMLFPVEDLRGHALPFALRPIRLLLSGSGTALKRAACHRRRDVDCGVKESQDQGVADLIYHREMCTWSG